MKAVFIVTDESYTDDYEILKVFADEAKANEWAESYRKERKSVWWESGPSICVNRWEVE